MFVYILFSDSTNRYYVGISDDLIDRLARHNGRRSLSTKSGVPWKLIWSREVESRSEAMILEKRIKKRGAQRFLDKLSE